MSSTLEHSIIAYDVDHSGTNVLTRYHPFWKLVSQMVFGVHLLANQSAKSEPQVMKILQTHIDEMDGFLQRTTEDFLIIHLDVRTRIQYLNLPLGNLDVFDQMLGDRTFRLSLVAYNDQIEHATDRFTLAITDAIRDLRKGKDAISALWHYLIQLSDEGCFESHSLKAFHQAMMDNLEGWLEALSKLRRRGAALQKALGQLAFAVIEMQRRVGIASRKDVQSFVGVATRNSTRTMSLKHKLSIRSSHTPSRYLSSSNKPLPRDPLLEQKNPKSRHSGNTEHQEKGNMNRSKTNAMAHERNAPRILSRAKSCSALAMDSSSDGTGPSAPPPIPRTPGSLSRKLSRPFLPKRSASAGENAETAQDRPATAPARTLKSRSVSMEQLKGLWANGRPRTQQSTPKSPPRQQRGLSHQTPEIERSESMKEQISQFLKTDRVVEAWDTMTTKTGTCGRSLSRTAKDWPCSIFRAKSPNAWRARAGKGTDLTDTHLERQMSWVQDAPETLNTYSFKQRPETSPRIHVLSVQMTLDEDLRLGAEIGEEDVPDGTGSDTGSIITALPSLPPPTPATIPSVASEYRPRTVECARG